MELKVNGQVHQITDADSKTPLLFVLRNKLGLTAAKAGCGLSQCGACTVVIDGVARMSCQVPASSVIDSEITTLEGIGTRAAPHPLQRAFVEANAAQCGFCTTGIIMASKALLDRNPAPSPHQIREALAENLCRCGAHNRVVRAVQHAAKLMEDR